ncbi:MAG: methylmalonyl Co-A mutase-associated GTPase MeaB [Alicyclobacillaceae bacterium]|nr:methylmalonyl Co-A mutase-associated GTPase MeaB [Alicyclobacillaceae bacterium]
MHPLADRIAAGDRRAVAQAMTVIEQGGADARELLRSLPSGAECHVVGLTGAPGAGKSSLADCMIRAARTEGLKVGVIAVDPSSPFSGGALLGDRVRMARHSADDGVFIRSVANRGSLGGLADSARDMVRPLAAFGCRVVLLETVGVGQSEVDVMRVADTVVLVLIPGAGDQVQVAKSGVMEIADVFAVNKSDLPGADALARDIRRLVEQRAAGTGWTPPVICCSAATGDGVERVWQAVQEHRAFLAETGLGQARRRQWHQEAVLRRLETVFRQWLQAQASRNSRWRDVLADEQLDAGEAAERLLEHVPWLSGSARLE